MASRSAVGSPKYIAELRTWHLTESDPERRYRVVRETEKGSSLAMPTIQARRTRTPDDLRRAADDDACNREISRIVFGLPAIIERRIQGHLFMGAGEVGLNDLRDRLANLEVSDEDGAAGALVRVGAVA